MTNNPLWTIDAVLMATGGKLAGCKADNDRIEGVSIDSRTTSKDDLFVAIVGDRMDGHDFVAKALIAGAKAAIVSTVTDEMKKAGALIVVDDPLVALEKLGRAARARCKGKIIGVTGSVGKTSTKEALRLCFEYSGKTHASVASFNNHWGVPLTLARMPKDTDFGVFEIGMNHKGEILELTDMVRPDISIITEIAESHLGHFSDLSEIADAKAEIFTGQGEDGIAIINRDSPFFDQLSAHAASNGLKKNLGFGAHENSDFHLEKYFLHADCSTVQANIDGEQVSYKIAVPGYHMVMNSIGVLGVVKMAGGDLAKAALAFANFAPAHGRGVQSTLRCPTGQFSLIDESYNANPTSMRAAISVLGNVEPAGSGRRIVALGDMLELGDNAKDLHKGLLKALVSAEVDQVFVSGAEMKHLWDDLPENMRGVYGESSSDLVASIISGMRGGDVIMIKGSLGSRMAVVVDALHDSFDPEKGRKFDKTGT